MVSFKIRKTISHGPRHPFYRNVAFYHLKRPQIKIENNGTVDGHPIIHVDTGVAQ